MILAVAQTGVGGYAILFLAVAASWVGIPIIGASVLAAAGVLASEGDLNIWAVVCVASVAAWTGGYIGYRLGHHAGRAIAEREGRWRAQRRRAMQSGIRIYQRWGRLGVFLTPTWVSGALGMPRNTFLVWNGLAAILSTCIAALSAYGIGTAVLGQLSERRGLIELVVAGAAVVAAIFVLARRRVVSRAKRSDPPQDASAQAPRDDAAEEVYGRDSGVATDPDDPPR